MKDYFNRVEETKKWLEEKVKIRPEIMMILSGGVNDFISKIDEPVTISSSEIPGFPTASCEGHEGKLTFGKFGATPVVVLQGRFHYYEGHPPSDVVFPIFVMNALGAKKLITTNATGGINKNFKCGDMMLIEDHINLMGMNPLIGITTQKPENQFTDMTNAYSKNLAAIAHAAAKEVSIDLKDGVYCATSGPSYETPAEVSMLRKMGADAVGMSTVPETIAANYLGMEVMSVSCIANPAADLHPGGMSHTEVLENMKKMEIKLCVLLEKIMEKLG